MHFFYQDQFKKKYILKINQNIKKVMKNITKIQNEIINDHLLIEGSENFDFYPCEDGTLVIMVNKYDGEETKITKSNPEVMDLWLF
jgi:hypothetical protein